MTRQIASEFRKLMTTRSVFSMAGGLLAIVLLGTSLGMSAKYGADLNYFLSLRVPESLAIGTLWHAGRTAKGRRRSAALSAAALLAIVALVPVTWARCVDPS